MKEKELANMIKIWFDCNESNKNLFCKSPVGKVIKEEMKKRGNWKERARWHPPSDNLQRNFQKALDGYSPNEMFRL